MSQVERTSPGTRMPGRELVLLVGILVLAAVLRFDRLGLASLNVAEAWSWSVASRPAASDVIEAARGDFNPPLYWLTLQAWIRLAGAAEWSLRALSAVFGVVAVGAMYLLGRDAARFPCFDHSGSAGEALIEARRAGLFCSALLATSLLHVVWSQQVRMYAMGSMLTVMSSWCLLRALARSSSRMWWVSYAVSAVCLTWTHNFGSLAVAAQSGFVAQMHAMSWLRRRPDGAPALLGRARWPVVCVGFTALTFMPWVAWATRDQLHRVVADYWIPESTWRSPLEVIWAISFPADIIPIGDNAAIVWFDIVALLLIVGMFWTPPGSRLFAWLFALPIVAGTIISFTVTPLLVPRHYQFAHVGLLGCLGLLVSRIQWRWPRRIAIVLLVGLSLYQTLSFREKLDVPGRPGLRAVCEQIRAADDETRLVVVRSSYLFHAAKFYLPNYQVRMLLEDGWPPDYFGGGIMTDADFVSEDTLRSASAFWQLSQRNPDRFQRIANVQRVSPVYSARLVGRFSSAGLVYAARFRPQPPQRN